MLTAKSRGGCQSREATGFLVSVAFVGLAAVRDVFLGGLFQRMSPLRVIVAAFTLCSLLLQPIALLWSRESLAVLVHRPHDLFWVKITSAGAWLAFFYALRLIEPSLVQILYSGIGPLSVVWIDRHFPGGPVPLTRVERPIYVGLLASLAFAAAVALEGLSGAGAQPVGVTAVGVVFARAVASRSPCPTHRGAVVGVAVLADRRTPLCGRRHFRWPRPTACHPLGRFDVSSRPERARTRGGVVRPATLNFSSAWL